MRHNQNGRRFRGRSNNGAGGGNSSSGGGNQSYQGNSHQRRVNPRVQTFDSNGPDVRIRGNAYQINEKYLALARDAAAAGDRVLAESYYQHAEHYQRFVNEIGDEFNRYQPQQSQQQQYAGEGGDNGEAQMDLAGAEQPSLNDLDQGFLVGPRHTAPVVGEQPQPVVDGHDMAAGEMVPQQQTQRRGRQPSRQRETETA